MEIEKDPHSSRLIASEFGTVRAREVIGAPATERELF